MNMQQLRQPEQNTPFVRIIRQGNPNSLSRRAFRLCGGILSSKNDTTGRHFSPAWPRRSGRRGMWNIYVFTEGSHFNTADVSNITLGAPLPHFATLRLASPGEMGRAADQVLHIGTCIRPVHDAPVIIKTKHSSSQLGWDSSQK